MAKKARKAAASKARKTKSSTDKTRAAKARRKAGTKAISLAKKETASKPAAKRPETFSHKIAGAVRAVLDTLKDAEQIHHRLDPDPSRDLDPE